MPVSFIGAGQEFAKHIPKVDLGAKTVADYNWGDKFLIVQQYEANRGITNQIVEWDAGFTGEKIPAKDLSETHGRNPYTGMPYINPDGRSLTEKQTEIIIKRKKTEGQYNQMHALGEGGIGSELLGTFATPDMVVEGLILTAVTLATEGVGTAPAMLAVAPKIAKIARLTHRAITTGGKAKKALTAGQKIAKTAMHAGAVGLGEGAVFGTTKFIVASKDDQGRGNTMGEAVMETFCGGILGGALGGAGRAWGELNVHFKGKKAEKAYREKTAKARKEYDVAKNKAETEAEIRQKNKINNDISPEMKNAMVVETERLASNGATHPAPPKYLRDLSRHEYTSKAKKKQRQSDYDRSRWEKDPDTYPDENILKTARKYGKQTHDDFSEGDFYNFYKSDKDNLDILNSDPELKEIRNTLNSQIETIKRLEKKGSPDQTLENLFQELETYDRGRAVLDRKGDPELTLAKETFFNKANELQKKFDADLTDEQMLRMLMGDNILLEEGLVGVKMDRDIMSMKEIHAKQQALTQELEKGYDPRYDPEIAQSQKQALKGMREQVAKHEKQLADTKGTEATEKIAEIKETARHAKEKFADNKKYSKQIEEGETNALREVEKIEKVSKAQEDYINCRAG